MKHKRPLLVILFFLVHSLGANVCPMNQIKQFADGLNIEGGTIQKQYLREGQIWSNLCVVLDRPFEDGVEWQELTNSNTFMLKEASLPDYNEAQVNFAYATVLEYYITHSHQLSRVPQDQTVKILVQVHRNTSGPKHIELLVHLLEECYPDLRGCKRTKQSASKHELFTCFFSAINVEVDYCYGAAPENLGRLGKYSEVDIVVSFSLVAGLNPNWKSGSLCLPCQHIPFCLKTVCLSLQNTYSTQNHLLQVIDDVVEHQKESAIRIINEKFLSLNPEKHTLIAKKLTRGDFHEAILLQVDSLFNPSQLPAVCTVETRKF